ncbi:MAG: HNH endonuclease signature motif containing protein [Ilumatobacteraceae bacterium]
MEPVRPSAASLESAGRSYDELATAICAGAANLTAYEYRWLCDVAEFDRRRGWMQWEQVSCAAWLSWQVGLDARSAREKVRVARALERVPLVAAAMSRGHLCYSKVRALTRVVTPATEQALLELALESTTAQFERIVAATRRATQVAEADAARIRRERCLHHLVEPDGSVTITLRLTGDDGAVFLAAVERFVAERVPGDPIEPVAARRADAAVSMALAASATEPSLAPPALVTVHVDCTGARATTASPTDEADAIGATAPSPAAAPIGHDPSVIDTVHVNRRAPAVDDRIEGAGPADLSTSHAVEVPPCTVDVGDSAVPVAPAAVLRACCDAVVEVVTHHADGEVTMSRRAGVVRGTQRRAVLARDRHCQFPGCTRSAGVEVHHLVHRAHGGGNHPDNLVVLCRSHHHRLHDDHWSARRTVRGLEFTAPDGRVFAEPSVVTGDPQQVLDLGRSGDDGRCRWQGDRLELVEALGFLASLPAVAERAATHRFRVLVGGNEHRGDRPRHAGGPSPMGWPVAGN